MAGAPHNPAATAGFGAVASFGFTALVLGAGAVLATVRGTFALLLLVLDGTAGWLVGAARYLISVDGAAVTVLVCTAT